MSPHSAADIDNFAEIRQRGTSANKIDLFGRAGLGDSNVKKFEPKMRVSVWFNSNHPCFHGSKSIRAITSKQGNR